MSNSLLGSSCTIYHALFPLAVNSSVENFPEALLCMGLYIQCQDCEYQFRLTLMAKLTKDGCKWFDMSF